MELRAVKWTKLVIWNVSKVQGLLKLSLWERETPGQMFNVTQVYFSLQDTGSILSSLSVHPCPTSQQQSVWIPSQWGQFSPESDRDRDLNLNRVSDQKMNHQDILATRICWTKFPKEGENMWINVQREHSLLQKLHAGEKYLLLTNILATRKVLEVLKVFCRPCFLVGFSKLGRYNNSNVPAGKSLCFECSEAQAAAVKMHQHVCGVRWVMWHPAAGSRAKCLASEEAQTAEE